MMQNSGKINVMTDTTVEVLYFRIIKRNDIVIRCELWGLVNMFLINPV